MGISEETETCQIRGLGSHDSPCWTKILQMGIHGLGVRLTKKQTTSTHVFLWPDIWKDMSEAAQRKEKQKWANQKPKLDNARRLRGIYFIDPADAEFKETNENARRKLEVSMPAAMPCKIRRRKYKETCRTPDARRTKYAGIVEADKSTRMRLEGTLHKDHEDHIAGKGIKDHYNLVHKFIPVPEAMKNTRCESRFIK